MPQAVEVVDHAARKAQKGSFQVRRHVADGLANRRAACLLRGFTVGAGRVTLRPPQAEMGEVMTVVGVVVVDLDEPDVPHPLHLLPGAFEGGVVHLHVAGQGHGPRVAGGLEDPVRFLQ